VSEESPPESPPQAAHAAVLECEAAHAAGDDRRARQLLAALPADATAAEGDRAAIERLRHALTLDPVTWIAGAVFLVIWIVVFWRVALS
jgi:hypothetical protein